MLSGLGLGVLRMRRRVRDDKRNWVKVVLGEEKSVQIWDWWVWLLPVPRCHGCLVKLGGRR